MNETNIKRRSFLKGLFGAISALFAPKVMAGEGKKEIKRRNLKVPVHLGKMVPHPNIPLRIKILIDINYYRAIGLIPSHIWVNHKGLEHLQNSSLFEHEALKQIKNPIFAGLDVYPSVLILNDKPRGGVSVNNPFFSHVEGKFVNEKIVGTTVNTRIPRSSPPTVLSDWSDRATEKSMIKALRNIAG